MSSWSPEVVSSDDSGPGLSAPEPGVGQGLGGSQPLSLGPDQQTGDQTLALLRDVIKLRQTEVIAATNTHLVTLLGWPQAPGDVAECLRVGVAEEGGEAGEEDVGDDPDLD